LDHLNSTKMVTDENGEVEVNYTYRAFGEQLKMLDKGGNETGDSGKYSYGGKELDDNTNLYYFNARYYDAVIGRYINVDPVQDGSNWYVYCNNNPLSFVDPTGLFDKDVVADLLRNDSEGRIALGMLETGFINLVSYSYGFNICTTKKDNDKLYKEGRTGIVGGYLTLSINKDSKSKLDSMQLELGVLDRSNENVALTIIHEYTHFGQGGSTKENEIEAFTAEAKFAIRHNLTHLLPSEFFNVEYVENKDTQLFDRKISINDEGIKNYVKKLYPETDNNDLECDKYIIDKEPVDFYDGNNDEKK